MTLSNRTFGIEMEIKRVERRDAVQALQDAGLQAYDANYSHRVSSSWKVVYDGSLSGLSCEVVSPILRGEEGIQEARKAARALSQAGARVDRECGLHVHVGVADLTVAQVGHIVTRYGRFEPSIDEFMPRSRRNGSPYSRTIRSVAQAIENEQGRHMNVNHMWDRAARGGRYYKVNLACYRRQKTIEFRQHSGTTNTNKIENWIRFLINFVEESARRAPAQRVTQRRNVGTRGVNRKLDLILAMLQERERNQVIIQNRALRGMTVAEIAGATGLSVSSVPSYISRLRTERNCEIRKNRQLGTYRLVSVGQVATEQRQAARAVETAPVSEDTLFAGIPSDVVGYLEERRQDLAS